jgi:hypothetical protein
MSEITKLIGGINMEQPLSIVTACDGAAIELVERAVSNAVLDFQVPEKDQKEPRKIFLHVILRASEDMKSSEITFRVEEGFPGLMSSENTVLRRVDGTRRAFRAETQGDLFQEELAADMNAWSFLTHSDGRNIKRIDAAIQRAAADIGDPNKKPETPRKFKMEIVLTYDPREEKVYIECRDVKESFPGRTPQESAKVELGQADVYAINNKEVKKEEI